jgi:hypothetical protein
LELGEDFVCALTMSFVGFIMLQGKAGMAMYSDFEQDRDRGNFDKLPELHAVLSGMKVRTRLRRLAAVAHLVSTCEENTSV